MTQKKNGLGEATVYRILKKLKKNGNNSSPSEKSWKLNTVDQVGDFEKNSNKIEGSRIIQEKWNSWAR